MRITEIITEAANLLYHKTEANRLNGMAKRGYIGVSSPELTNPDWDYEDYGSVSLTRNPDWYHYNDEANAVMIVVDANALRQLSDVKSHAWSSGYDGVGPADSEEEERIGQNIPFNRQYIKQVIVHYNEDQIKPKTLAWLKASGIPVKFTQE